MGSIGELEHFLLLEQTRATILDAVRRLGHTRLSLAEEAGISTRMVAAVLKGDSLHPSYMRSLEKWCWEWGIVGVPPQKAALALMVSGLPLDARLDARAAFAEWYAERFTQAGRPVPDWIVDELDDYGYLTRKRRQQGDGASDNPATHDGQHA